MLTRLVKTFLCATICVLFVLAAGAAVNHGLLSNSGAWVVAHNPGPIPDPWEVTHNPGPIPDPWELAHNPGPIPDPWEIVHNPGPIPDPWELV